MSTMPAHVMTDRGGVGVRPGELVASGSRSSVFAWGRDAVVKVPFSSTPEAWIHFEARYTAAVHDAGAPAPRFLGIETVNGRAASVYERVHGRSMWEHMRERPEQIPAYTQLLAELQAHLFSLVPPVSLPALHDRLTCKIRRAAEQVDPALVAALECVPASARTRLCHGDLHPGNIIMAGEGPVIIDWFDAARGDPLADIARSSLLMWARAHGQDGPSHLPGAAPDLLVLVRSSYLVAITELVAPNPDDLLRWVAVDTVARIAEGIAIDALLAIWHDTRCPGLSPVLDDGS